MAVKNSIKRLSAYRPPLEGRNDSKYMLLDFNERTIEAPAAVKSALIDYIESGGLQRYPEYGDILDQLAAYVKVEANELVITNGSDQGIDLVYRVAAEANDEAIVPAPTFPMLDHSAEIAGMKVHRPTYTSDFEYPYDKVLESISDRTRVIVICTPNNPTGTLVSREHILSIAQSAPQAAILVDECYFEYSNASVTDAINTHRNLFITRTFSKTWGMPSLRFGYIVTNSNNAAELTKIRGPYDVNRLAIVAAQAALANRSYVSKYVDEVIQSSRPTLERFLDSKGIRYWPSHANFLLCYFPQPQTIEAQLRERGILVRPRTGPGIDGTIRITLGTAAQTELLIKELEQVL